MSDIKELAKRVYEERKEVERRKIEDSVKKILEIFNASNSLADTLLVWQMQLKKENSCKSLDICVSFDKVESQKFHTWKIFDSSYENVPILKVMLKELEIPKELLDDLYEYFNKNLSEYFETKRESNYSIIIKLKNEPICEKEEPR